MSALRVKSNSSQAVRPRTAWFLIIVKIGTSFECHAGWKYSDNSIGLFSLAKNSSTTRPPFGALTGCKFEMRKNKKGETNPYFTLRNDDAKTKQVSLKCTEINPILWKINDITQDMADIKRSKNFDLLSLFLRLLWNSEGFLGHNDETFNKIGMKKDGTGDQLKDIEEKGGSLKQLEDFITKAKTGADIVPSKLDILKKVQGGKRKRKIENEENVCKIKRTKTEKIELEKAKEIKSDDGLETTLKNSYVGRVDIPLEQLSLSPRISLPINRLKVLALAKGMESRFDPSLVAVTCCPAEPGVFDKTKLEKNNYHIVHGRHRFEALKKLDEEGKLTKLTGMQGRTVTCHVIQTECAVQMNYSLLRGNELAANFVATPKVHELLFTYQGLKEHIASKKAIESVERYAKTLSIGPEDITALKKLCGWPAESFTALVDVVEKYQAYQTEDVKIQPNRLEGLLMRGESMPVPKTLLRKLSKIDSNYFKELGICIIYFSRFFYYFCV